MTSALPPAPPSVEPPGYAPPPPPPGPPVRPQLRRSRTDKIIGGVNGGLAEYTGIDALLWRVGFVALALAGGTGILVYLLLWLLMPAGPALTPSEEVAARAARVPAGPRSPVPGVTLAGLLIAIGVLVLVDRFTDLDVDAVGFLGAALLVVGAGLVVAAFTGGRTARGGLLAVGVVLSLALIAASSVPWRDIDGVGDRTFRPASALQVRDVYDGGIGDLTLDLSGIDVGDLDEPVTTRIDHGVGDIDVVVPRDADLELQVDQGLGEVRVFGTNDADGYFDGRGSGSWTGDGDPEIVLVINSGIGDVEVSRG